MHFPLVLALALASADPAEDLQCLQPAADQPATSTLFYSSLQRQAYAALDRRQSAYEELKTPEQIAAWRDHLRGEFTERLGGWPERTPLNSQVVGKIAADGYRLEKIIFESQPQHHVTATLYLPDGPAPYPIVLVSSGHSRTAKAAEYNQRFGITLAKHGWPPSATTPSARASVRKSSLAMAARNSAAPRRNTS